jgi:acyl phosphate:glycerol-3-phosphate acyltransferase
MLFILILIFAYILGSLSSAILVCKFAGLPDPRTEGSGNPGTTNVLRVGGKKLAAMVFIGDVLKGVIPVLLAKWLGFSSIEIVSVALAVFIGHLFPIFFGFRGGKGVATAFGILFTLAWPLGLAALVTWLLVAFISRFSSLAALVGAALAPVYAYWLADRGYWWGILLISILLFWRHTKNIRQLLAGTESKIGGRSNPH